ncbi:MAG: YcxB family protein [Chitinophagaceae bacterium]|nr:YcxB family protein [Chitinophagaceae bacterium]
MGYSFQYTLTPEEYALYNVYTVWSAPDKRQYRIQSFISIFFLGAMGAISAIYMMGSISSRDMYSSFSWIVVGVLSLVVAVIFNLSVGPRTKKNAVRLVQLDENKYIISESMIELTDQNLHHKDDNSETYQSYHSIARVSEANDCIYIYVNTVQAYIIPKRIFKSKEEEDDVLKFLTQKISVTSSLRSISS